MVNTAADPVPVTGTVAAADNPARQAVQQSFSIELTNFGGGESSVTIPAGKIFVLEFVSFRAIAPGGVREVAIGVDGPHIDGTRGRIDHDLVIPPPQVILPGGPNENLIIGSQALRLYAQPGTQLVILFSVFGLASSATTLDATVSGYFVNAQ